MQQFSTFGTAVNTCFAILLGDISVNDDLNQLQGLQGVAATLFFWSFELLVFMVLLNFLLAIIVDAFSEVKENTHETTGMPLPCDNCCNAPAPYIALLQNCGHQLTEATLLVWPRTFLASTLRCQFTLELSASFVALS